MKALLIIGWLLLLAFVTWEFLVAKELPKKYSRLRPITFRAADIAIGLLAVFSIWYIASS